MPQYSTEQGSGLASSGTIFNLQTEEFEQLLEKGLSLDQVYLLEQATRQNILLRDFRTEKAKANIVALVRKGFVTHMGAITLTGRAVLEALSKQAGPPMQLFQSLDIDFEAWWEAFPSTDQFEYKGQKFHGSRGLRRKKEQCKGLYKKILNEGNYSAQDLLRALKYEVELKKESSFREKENKIRYMTNTLSYLNGRIFEDFVELSRQKTASGKGEANIDI